jgi:hypothetical protein
LGSPVHPTGIAVVERGYVKTGETFTTREHQRTDNGQYVPIIQERAIRQCVYHVVDLDRVPREEYGKGDKVAALGEAYAEIARLAISLSHKHDRACWVVLDVTYGYEVGVQHVRDALNLESDRQRARHGYMSATTPVIPIRAPAPEGIVGGELGTTNYTVSRGSIGMSLLTLLTQKRLKVASKLKYAAALQQDILSFDPNVAAQRAANPALGDPWRIAAHDDLVLAVGAVCHIGEVEMTKELDVAEQPDLPPALR